MRRCKADARQPVVQQHFRSDKYQQEREPRFEVMEFVDDVDQQEEHRPESQNCENVGEKHDVRIFGYGKDSRNGIDSEDEVGKLNDQQHQK